ncbi:MAG: hypothetical protein IPL49_02450 [Saprospirales bacterium]|nr:hypothetical protein [Saprospirales bacterium]MBK8489778.1 hypothetical protein [Saprospirales bacterium]
MKQSKIATLLTSFSPASLHRFRKYLLSPVCNEHSELVKLFDLLVQEVIPETENNLDKEGLWKALYDTIPFHDQTLRRLNSELTRHALSFQALQAFQADPFWEAEAVLPYLLEPGLSKHFDGVIRQVEGIRQKEPGQSPASYYRQLQIELLRHQQLEASGKKPDTLGFLESADFYLDCFYFTQKLKNHCDALGYQKTLALEADLGKIPGLLDYLELSPFSEIPLVKAYLLVLYMLIRPEEEKPFQELHELLKTKGRQFAKGEQQTLFIHLMNYCIDAKINKGQVEYFGELFQLYQGALDQQIILEEGILDPFHYKNIITVGLRVQAFEWTENFIQQYTPLLPELHQANARTYNLAKVYFQQQHYEKVIEQLQEVEYQNLVYALGAKLMLLKTYFELGEFLPLDSLSESFRIFLQRNQRISREVKQQYLNVLRFVKKLSHIRPKDAKAIGKIRQQVSDCQALADKPWILEKIEELA